MTVNDESQSSEFPLGREALKQEAVALVKAVALFLLLFLLAQTFIIEGVPVNGPSMSPTLEDGDRILVLKLPRFLAALPGLHALHDIRPGDLVVFRSPDSGNRRFVKRVVAEGAPLPRGNVVEAYGHTDGVPVRYDHGAIYVNNRRIEEPYLAADEQTGHTVQEVRLQAGEYYVLGDHRSVSKDSRRVGPIHEDQIVGRAVLRVWPLSKFGAL